jgi:predicted esterase
MIFLIFISHGTVDQVIPVAWAKKTVLDQLSINSIYKEYPIGHGISPHVFGDFTSWLKTHKEGSKYFGTFFYYDTVTID